MKPIAPPGYAYDEKALRRRTEELRQARSSELANAFPHDRARIEKEILRESQIKVAMPDLAEDMPWWHIRSWLTKSDKL